MTMITILHNGILHNGILHSRGTVAYAEVNQDPGQQSMGG